MWLEWIAQDLRHGCRMLVANPGFTLVAVISLALGIGANSAAFSWADALLLRPLSVARPGEVVTVGSAMSVEGFSSINASYREYVDIRDRATSFDGLVAFSGMTAGLAATRDVLPELTLGMLVSGNFFTVMGVEPALGRAFLPEEHEVPGRDAVVMLSHRSGNSSSRRTRRSSASRCSSVASTSPSSASPPRASPGMNQFVRSDFYAPLMMWPRLARRSEGAPARRPPHAQRHHQGTAEAGREHVARAGGADPSLPRIWSATYPDTNKNRGLIVRTELQTRIAQSPPDATLIAMLTTLARRCCSWRARTWPGC